MPAIIPDSITQPASAQADTGNLAGAINVRDLGAKGDGSTDDTRAIQAAIKKAKAATIKKVFLPAGTYAVSDTLRLYDNVQLIGAGKDVAILKMVETNTDLIDIGDASDVYIGRLQVRDVTNPGLKDENWGIVTRAAVRPVIESVKAVNNDDAGIRIGYSDEDLSPTKLAKVIDCEVINTKEGSGIEVIRAESAVVKGNTVTGSKQHGIRICGAVKTTVTDNKVTNNHSGISVQGFTNGEELLQPVTGFTLANNIVVNNKETGIELYNTAQEGTIAENEISSKDVRRNFAGIDLKAVDGRGNQNIRIIDNTIINAGRGVSLSGRQKEVRIRGNTVHGPPSRVQESYGVFIDADSMKTGSIDDVYVEHNNLESGYNTWYCIHARDLPEGSKVYARYNTITGDVPVPEKSITSENGEKLITRIDGKETNTVAKRRETGPGKSFLRRVLDDIQAAIAKMIRSLAAAIKDFFKQL